MSGFSDFILIFNEILKWLNYEICFFGFYLSIYNIVFACTILSIGISIIKKVFVGD